MKVALLPIVNRKKISIECVKKLIKRLHNPINNITFASQKHKGCLVRVARSRSAKPFTAVRIRQAPQKNVLINLKTFFFVMTIQMLRSSDYGVGDAMKGQRNPMH